MRNRRFAAGVLACGFCLISPAADSFAAEYPVRSLAENEPRVGGYRVFSRPAINDDGTVAFVAAEGGGTIQFPTRYFVQRIGPDGRRTRIDVAPLDGAGGERGVAIDRSGAITLRNQERLHRIGPDGTRTPLVDTAGPFDQIPDFAVRQDAVGAPYLFQGRLDGQQDYGVFNGPDPVANRLDNPAVQTSPVPAGFGRDGAPRFIASRNGTRAVYSGPDPQANLVMDLSAFTEVLNYTENARGDVLFRGYRDGVNRLYTGPDPMADRLDVVPGAAGGLLNDHGQMIVWTESGPGGNAEMYLVTGGVAERVIGRGDPLFGSTLAGWHLTDLEQQAFNNRGEFTFQYGLADGTVGVAVLTVPEPAGLVALGLVALGVMPRRRGTNA